MRSRPSFAPLLINEDLRFFVMCSSPDCNSRHVINHENSKSGMKRADKLLEEKRKKNKKDDNRKSAWGSAADAVSSDQEMATPAISTPHQKRSPAQKRPPAEIVDVTGESAV